MTPPNQFAIDYVYQTESENQMINIYQIQLTNEQYNAVNANEKVPAFEVKCKASMGKFDASNFEFYDLAYTVYTSDLEKAFEWTNLWNNQPAVDVIGDRTHSSSVGDIFVLNGEWFICAMMGFEKIEINFEKEAA